MSLANVEVLLRADHAPVPMYSGVSGRMSLMLNVTVDDDRVVFTGLTTKNFEFALFNPRSQVLTTDDNIKSVTVSETSRPGVYFASLDWHAGNGPSGLPGHQIAWLGPTMGVYVLVVRMHQNGSAFIGQTILQFEAAFAEPLGE